MDAKERARLGARIRQVRRDAGRSQADVASAAGIAPNTLSAIEAGRKSWDANLSAVARELGIEAADGGYPPDVEVVMDVVGGWLSPMPPGQRRSACRALGRFMSTWSSASPDADLRQHIPDDDLAQIDASVSASAGDQSPSAGWGSRSGS